ncbi:MAG: winged helix-turn-helix transcriptional regulator [Candidatus Bathyarchaeia archaeon]|jgi:predicted transcriptional regulator
MFKDEILENERRSNIYATIKKNPGLHVRQLQRILGIPLSSLQYHLNYMARRHVILEEKSEHYTRYYSKPLEAEDKKVLSVLRQKRLREIVMIILVSKKAKYHFIVQTLKLPSSTVSFYLKHLLDNHVIERTKIGYENIYTLTDEDRIEKVLIAYQSSFLDKLVDKWASTWLENRFGKEKPNEEILE